ncbi:uncharacterized protein A4U43_C05F25970 [Asparagus officinalis]|uniref:Uncharacterized protein n=1 Tax=Asparagus officinalis TaxID=4686 RepID=A0A5P1EUJ2_ASPOF|nr:uncharacterized protein A4U43_C05F25970 [Asparagus officinalis]
MDRKSKFLTTQNPRSSRVLGIEKGKSKLVSLEEGSADLDEAEVWKRFEEAGLLDESKLRWKDREALVERIHELEKELYDYQYHMGLLLIEKEKQASEYEEMRQALAEADGIFNKEQTTHMIAIAEFEKREENFQKALMAEKQCIEDLKVQKLLGDLKLSLDSKNQEFELELDKKRNSFEEDLKEKLDDLERVGVG